MSQPPRVLFPQILSHYQRIAYNVIASLGTTQWRHAYFLIYWNASSAYIKICQASPFKFNHSHLLVGSWKHYIASACTYALSETVNVMKLEYLNMGTKITLPLMNDYAYTRPFA